jgi:hypothetical protein
VPERASVIRRQRIHFLISYRPADNVICEQGRRLGWVDQLRSASGQGRLSSPGRWYGRSAFISGNAVCAQRLALGARNRLAVMTTDSSDWRKAVIRLLRSLRAGTGPANEALQGSGSEPKAYLASERLGTPNVEST